MENESKPVKEIRPSTCSRPIAPFVNDKGWIYIDGQLEGSLLEICGQDYECWFYDRYIYEAIALAKKWKPEHVTYGRIVHLRYWLREDVQHCHNLGFKGIRTIEGVKRRIDELIQREYGNDEYWKEQKACSLAYNAATFLL